MLSRRKFCKICLAAGGLTALGGWGLRSRAGLTNSTASQSTADNPSGNTYRPRYLDLAKSGELERRERELWKKMESCSLCPRNCGVNRMEGKAAVCNSDHRLIVASTEISHAEERVTVGRGGTGSIFISNCSMLCVFCQNWNIAHKGRGRVTTHAELAHEMLLLKERGAINIGIVTPTHVVPHIVSALRIAVDQGLDIPLIYNTGGYESLEVVRLLDGIVDIYIPDFKFMDSKIASPFMEGAVDYAEYTAAAIKEMHRQVGPLDIVDGVANRGLLVRHLVLPENLAGTDKFVRWAVDELGADTHTNIMSQYRPMFRAQYYPPLDRRLTNREFDQAMRWAREAGLRNFH